MREILSSQPCPVVAPPLAPQDLTTDVARGMVLSGSLGFKGQSHEHKGLHTGN